MAIRLFEPDIILIVAFLVVSCGLKSTQKIGMAPTNDRNSQPAESTGITPHFVNGRISRTADAELRLASGVCSGAAMPRTFASAR
jgi:hypothetical protein